MLKDAVGRRSTDRSEDAQVGAGVPLACAGAEIRPKGEDCVGGCSLRHAAGVEGVVNRLEGQVTVGANRDSRKSLIIKIVRERQGDERGAVIGVVAGIGRPRDDAAAPDAEGIVQARCRA